MCHSINVCAGATSRPLIRCAAPFKEYKCSSASARSQGPFCCQGLEHQSQLRGRLSVQSRARHLCFRCVGGTGALHAEHESTTPERHNTANGRSAVACLILVHLWPIQVGQCTCLIICLGPRHNSPLCKPT